MAARRTLNLLAATMLGTMDSNALVPVIALYAQHVGADLVTIGIIVGLFSAVHAPANLFFGRIADRFGRKLPLQRAPRAMPWRRLTSYAARPSPAAGYAAIFSLYFILGAFVALVPLHLQQELGYGALAVGLSFTAFAILSLLLHYPAGILADRFGPSTPAGIGLVAVALAMASIPLVRDLPALIVLMALFGVGHGFVFPAASTLVSRGADPGQHGLVTGLFYAVLVSGVAVGAPVMAAVASVTTFGGGIWASAWVSLVGLAFLAPFSSRPRRP